MRSVIQGGLIVIVALAASPAVGSEVALDAVPVPSGVDREVIALNLVQNGHRLSVAKLHGINDREALADFYRGVWADPLAEGVPGYIEEQAGPWTLVSRPTEDWHQVVQWRDTPEGLAVRVSVLELKTASDQVADVALPSGSTLLSSTGASDVWTDASTYLVHNSGSVSHVADFYRRHYTSEGWTAVMDRQVGSTHILLLTRSGKSAELAVLPSESGGTVAVINEVDERG